MNSSEQSKANSPAWKSEFPIEQNEEFQVTRRGFGVMCYGATAAGIAGLTLAALLPDSNETTPFAACLVDALAPGSSKVVTDPRSGNSILLIHLPSDEWRAYSQNCTHLLCPVHYDAERDHIFCPCHHGVFDSQSGKAVAGPPRKPLPSYRVETRDGVVYVGTDESPLGA